MGWLFFEKPDNIPEYFAQQVAFEDETKSVRIIDSAIVNFTEFYAAIETIDKATCARKVEALICLIRFQHNARDGMTFGYKDMGENWGPIQARCPKRILKLLTLLEPHQQHATEWRKNCHEYHEIRKRATNLKDGAKIDFGQPIKFTDGTEHRIMTIRRRGKRISFHSSEGGQYRIQNWRSLPFEQVA